MSWLTRLFSKPEPVAFAEAAPKPELRQIATLRTDFLRRYSFGDLLEPEDDILQTKGGGSWDIYDRIASDDQVFACFQQRRLAVVSCEWEVIPGDDRRVSRKAADFLRETLEALQWDSITDKMLWGVFYGKAIAECQWVRDGSFIHLAGLQVKPQRRFRFTIDKQLRLLTSEQPVTGLTLPDRKFWHFSTGANHDDAPDGLALAHYLYWLVLFKSNDLKFWLTYADQFGNPSKIGKYPPGSTKTEQNKLLQALQALSQDTGIIIPEGMVIELLEAQRTGSSDLYDKLHERMNSAIAKVILSQTMTTDNGSSRSQAEVHAGVKAEIVKADADLVCSSFNRTVAPWLIRDFNGANFPGAALPKVWRRLEEPEDLNARANRDKTLFDMGFRPTAVAVQSIYGENYADTSITEGEQLPSLAPILGMGGTTALMNFLGQLSQNGMSRENAIAVLVGIFGVPRVTAEGIVPQPQEQPSPSTPNPSTPPPPTASLDDVAALFAEGTIEFAGAAPGKKKNCTKGISCGNSCISANKTCAKPLSASQKQKKAQVSQGGGEADSGATATPQPEPVKEPVKPPRSDQYINQARISETRAKLAEFADSDTIDRAEKNVQKLLDESEIFIRVTSSETLEKIIDSGRFKTQFETGKSKGTQNRKLRAAAEEAMHGYPPNLDPVERPIYGYFGHPTDRSQDGDTNGMFYGTSIEKYGSIAIRLKSEVKDRATFTGADSLNNTDSVKGAKDGVFAPSSAKKVSAGSFYGSREVIDRDNLFGLDHQEALQGIAEAKSIGEVRSAIGNQYLESQVHGGVRTSDIAEIVIIRNPNNISKKSPKVSSKVEKWAKAQNVKIVYVDVET